MIIINTTNEIMVKIKCCWKRLTLFYISIIIVTISKIVGYRLKTENDDFKKEISAIKVFNFFLFC